MKNPLKVHREIIVDTSLTNQRHRYANVRYQKSMGVYSFNKTSHMTLLYAMTEWSFFL